MAYLNDVRQRISEYCSRYRREGLPQIEESPIYILNEDYAGENSTSDLRWPDTYPLAERRGVYAIFGASGLLYIGKASFQTLGSRLSNYFRYDENKQNCITNPKHTWSTLPTHLVAWAVPNDMPFEASALEEYLISSFNGDLPDSRIGNKV